MNSTNNDNLSRTTMNQNSKNLPGIPISIQPFNVPNTIIQQPNHNIIGGNNNNNHGGGQLSMPIPMPMPMPMAMSMNGNKNANNAASSNLASTSTAGQQ